MLNQTDAIDQLQQMLRQYKPDILLLDWELLEGQIDTLQALAKESPDSRIVIFSPSQPPSNLKTLLEAGARGCLSLNLSSKELMESLNTIATGDIVVSRGVAEHLVQGLSQSNDQEKLFTSLLSGRQREIISLVADGMTNREIASTLIITENTVKVHLRNILGKLELRNRQQLAAVAALRGFFRSPNFPVRLDKHLYDEMGLIYVTQVYTAMELTSKFRTCFKYIIPNQGLMTHLFCLSLLRGAVYR